MCNVEFNVIKLINMKICTDKSIKGVVNQKKKSEILLTINVCSNLNSNISFETEENILLTEYQANQLF